MSIETKYMEPVGFKGTEGEWDIYTDTEDKLLEIESGNVTVCHIHSIKNEEEANAALISQSKEMAKLLQEVVEQLECFPEDDFDIQISEKEYRSFLDLAKETLKKAII
jgi:hypothetical protein